MEKENIEKSKRRIAKFQSMLEDYHSRNFEKFHKRLGTLNRIELVMFLIHIDQIDYNIMEWAVEIKISLEEYQYHKQFEMPNYWTGEMVWK